MLPCVLRVPPQCAPLVREQLREYLVGFGAFSELEVTRCNVELGLVLEHGKLVARDFTLAQFEQLTESFDSVLILSAVIQIAAVDKDECFVVCLLKVEVAEEFFMELFLWFGLSDEHRAEVLNFEELLEAARLMDVSQHLDVAVQYVGILAFVLSLLFVLALLELIEHAEEFLVVQSAVLLFHVRKMRLHL